MNGTNKKKVFCKFGFFMALAAVLYLVGATNIVSGVKVQANVFPPGDICSEAIPVGEVTNLPFDTTGARFGGRGLCMVSPNVWYCYKALCTGDVTVSLLGSSYDTMLAVYDGCECFPTSNDFIACNDDYEVTVIDPNVELWVNVWLDFNRDGDWDDIVDCPEGSASEWAVQNQYLYNLPAGLNKITTPGFLSSHPQVGPENIWMRITLSEQPWKYGSNPGEVGNAGSGPVTKYEIGETEDYFFTPDTTVDVDCPLCEDLNEDGVIDIDDLVVLLTKWLASCP